MSGIDWIADSAAASVAFLKEATALCEELRSQGRSVYSLSYSWLSFGNWQIVAGTRYRRFELTWDGKEGQLILRTILLRMPKGTPPGARPQWQELTRIPKDDSRIPTDQSFAVARRLLSEHMPQLGDHR